MLSLPITREAAISTLRVLSFIVVPLSSLLVFLLPPVLARILIPAHGVSAMITEGLALFMQLSLLAGMGFALWLRRRTPLFQLSSVLGLALLSLAGTHLPSIGVSLAGSIPELVFALMIRCFLMATLLCSIPTFFVSWTSEVEGRVSHALFGLWFAGALAAVVLYPAGLERCFQLEMQVVLWVAFSFLVAALLAVAAYVRHSIVASERSQQEPPETCGVVRVLRWVLLAAICAAIARGSQAYLEAEIGLGSWTVLFPKAIFFATLGMAFGGWWLRSFDKPLVVLVAVSLFRFLWLKGCNFDPVRGGIAMWLMLLAASAGMLAARLLFEERPRGKAGLFYLLIALGFFLGDQFVAALGPWLFGRPIELYLAAALVVTLAVQRLFWSPGLGRQVVLLLIILLPIFAIWHWQLKEISGSDRLVFYRNQNGLSIVRAVKNGVILSDSTTLRATQIQESEASRGHPTLYHSESSAIGVVVGHLQGASPSLNVAILGLGGGPMAAYARKGDHYIFHETDAKQVRIANECFSYIKDSYGTISVRDLDGRAALSAAKTDYDLILVDSFQGGSIPAHLMTHEAMRLYVSRLLVRKGVLAYHVSSRYMDYFPMLASIASAQGLEAMEVKTVVSKPSDRLDFDGTTSYYVLVCRRENANALAAWFNASEDEGRVQRTVTRATPSITMGREPWTDTGSSLVDVFQLDRFMGWK